MKDFKVVKNFLSKEELKLLQPYCYNRILNDNWTIDPQCPVAPSFYNDAMMTVLLKSKLTLMEKETGLELFPTYSYWRYYGYDNDLHTHIDRNSCEVSASVCIKKSHDWPIHMNTTWVELEEGDAVLYFGAKVVHGRKPFKGDGMAQCFFHYVNKNGPYANHVGDRINENQFRKKIDPKDLKRIKEIKKKAYAKNNRN